MLKPILIATTALALAGCVSFSAKPPPMLLSLSADARVGDAPRRIAEVGDAVVITTPAVPAKLNTTRVPVQASATSIAYLKDAQWVEPPNRLFQRLLSETVSARTGRVVIDPRALVFDPAIRLAGELREFGLDGPKLEVRVTYDAIVQRKDKGIERRRFEAVEPVSAAKPAPVADALNRAANKVAADVAGWIEG